MKICKYTSIDRSDYCAIAGMYLCKMKECPLDDEPTCTENCSYHYERKEAENDNTIMDNSNM